MSKVTVIDGNPWKARFIASLAIFIIGVMFAVGGRGSLNIVLMIAGAIIALTSLIVMATQLSVSSIFGAALGAAGLILGVALIAVPNLFSDVLMLILAAMLLAIGILLLLSAPHIGIVGMVIAAVMVILGIYALFNLDSTADVVMVIIGVFMALSGLVGMAGALSSKRRLRKSSSQSTLYTFRQLKKAGYVMSEGRELTLGTFSIKRRLRELYDYRSVLRSLVEKGLYGRYKSSVLGFAWHFAMPLVYVAVCFFMYSEGGEDMENYWVFVAAGILAFHVLTSSVAGGTTCFTSNSGIIKKMYLPREIIAISSVTVSFIVMIIGYAAVIVFMAATGYPLNPVAMLLLVPLIVAMYLFCLGCTLALSSITVYVRDLQFLLGSLGIAFFVFSPIRYMAETVDGAMAAVLWANPFTYYLESFHSILYAGEVPDLEVYGMCFLLALISIAIGGIIFEKLKNGFAERL